MTSLSSGGLQRVQPLSVERVKAVYDREGWNYHIDHDGDISSTMNSAQIYARILGPENSILSILTYMDESLPIGLLAETRSCIEEWRRAHLWPAVFWRMNSDEVSFQVGAAVSVDWLYGVTDQQLSGHIQMAIATSLDAFDSLRTSLSLKEKIEVEVAARVHDYRFSTLNYGEKIALLEHLWEEEDHLVIIGLIQSIPESEWDDELRGRLAAAYTNSRQFDKAIAQLEAQSLEARREALWHYRYGCSLFLKAESFHGQERTRLHEKAKLRLQMVLDIDPKGKYAAQSAMFLGHIGIDVTGRLLSPAMIQRLDSLLVEREFNQEHISGLIQFCGRTVEVGLPFTPGEEGEALLERSLRTLETFSHSDVLWREKLANYDALRDAIIAFCRQNNAQVTIDEDIQDWVNWIRIDGPDIYIGIWTHNRGGMRAMVTANVDGEFAAFDIDM
ncbi:MAG: YbjN domain-containing protein [Actinomycetaceae bacterium]|nr:YbjN domain-containing protein [Actinomycetaceae bacterium]